VLGNDEPSNEEWLHLTVMKPSFWCEEEQPMFPAAVTKRHL